MGSNETAPASRSCSIIYINAEKRGKVTVGKEWPCQPRSGARVWPRAQARGGCGFGIEPRRAEESLESFAPPVLTRLTTYNPGLAPGATLSRRSAAVIRMRF